MAARITRVKHKIAAARIPYRVPDEDELPARLDAVRAARSDRAGARAGHGLALAGGRAQPRHRRGLHLRTAYQEAMLLTGNEAERDHLERRLAAD